MKKQQTSTNEQVKEQLDNYSATDLQWWLSPAKINLFLHICGRYENGYHELQTLFQLLDYYDEIGTQVNNSAQITLDSPIEGLNFEDNLLVKAARALWPYRASEKLGVTLHLRKKIPMGGGLGGGSSNAATVLLVLNKLWGCGLDLPALLNIAVKIGADVPLFVNGHSAFAQGVGDELINTQISPQYYLVATPNVHISTQAIFTSPQLPRNTAKIDFNDYQFDRTQNDCEKLVAKLHPEVASLLQWLLHYAPSRMTGTGASVFAQFDSFEAAQIVLNKLPSSVSAFVAKGIDVSPLYLNNAQLSAM